MASFLGGKTLIKIYNEDCIKTMDDLSSTQTKVDAILTSPPYNTGRDISRTSSSLKNYDSRYDVYRESMSMQQYIEWTVNIFNHIDNILNGNGVVLYNISYGTEFLYQSEQMWRLLVALMDSTNFTVGDRIIWKKSNAVNQLSLW